MEDSKTILLTGFTGVLGKRFAYCLAKLGYRVVCPIRAGSEAEARARFEQIFMGLRELQTEFDESLEQRFLPVPGDVREKGLGISASVARDLVWPQTAEVWHLAALLDLTETRSQDVYNTNLVGTLNVLNFVRERKIPRLSYFSTFGASGKVHEGVVREIPGIKPPVFRNTYERTKWEAERHVWQAQIHGEVMATIYRPSIVVGDSHLGRYEQFNVFNHPFDVASRVRKKLCKKQGVDPARGVLKYELRVSGDANATLNIVPLDFVIDAVMKIHSVRGSEGRVYHVVNPNPPPLSLMMEIFKRHEPWEGMRWEKMSPEGPFLNVHEKFVSRQFGFLAPYMLGEALYDYSNVQTILAFHGGMPPLNNETYLDTISRRAMEYGWQEVKADAEVAAMMARHGQLDSGFAWPEGSGLVVDFSPHHSAEEMAVPPPSYSVIERFLGRAYRLREKFFSKRGARQDARRKTTRDLVLLTFGMGISRRGEGEIHCYQHNELLAAQVFARINQVVGFDLRSFARHEVLGHAHFGDIHDHCCWAVADDLVHVLRLFRDLQEANVTDFASRLQILPHSGGIYLAGWLSGVLSFQDMILLVHQCAHFISENEIRLSREDVDRWFFSDPTLLTAVEREFLRKTRNKTALESILQTRAGDLTDGKFHGKLELVFSLNSHVLEQLIAEVRKREIGVSLAITMSPNTAIFGGNELEMSRFRDLFAGKRKIELRRVPLDVRGTPHCPRLKQAAAHTLDLLRMMNRQGRLRDPVISFPFHTGDLVGTREEFIQAVAGIADQFCAFDRMTERVMTEGGRHFLFVQSGLSSAAGDLFEGILRSIANARGQGSVEVYPPSARSGEAHPICKILPCQTRERIAMASIQSLEETIRWYERQLSVLRARE